jgi:hypothetical protein
MRRILVTSILVLLISGAASAQDLSDALDTNLNFTTGGEADWFSQTDIAFFDGDAAKSGDVDPNQESFLQTTVQGAGTISFYWKVSSEGNYDFLEFYIDGELQDRISDTVDWVKMMYAITESGVHNLEWRYVKDHSFDRGDDCGWVDHVEWSVPTPTKSPLGIPLSEALDTNLDSSTGGEAKWFSQTDIAFFDGDAAKSGDVDPNQESFLQITVDGTGTLSFYWKVCSEGNYDFLEFYIDGVLQDQISGSVDWHQMVYTISELGTHILEWRYVKDHSIDRDYDCGWVDLLEWSGIVELPLIDPLSEALDTTLNSTTGGQAEWLPQTDMACFDGDAAQSGDVDPNQESFLQMTVDGAGTISFYWKVCSEADCDFLEFYIDGMLQDRISGLVDWHQMTYAITGSHMHTLEWRYVKDGSTDRNDDCGWIDHMEWSDKTKSLISTPLSKALDTNLIIETGGDVNWFSQPRPYYSGYDAAQSGDIGDGQVSWMKTTIHGTGTLSFYWKVSSECFGDEMAFFIDDVLQDYIIETVDWHQMTYEITDSGLHTLEWRYVKDNGMRDDSGTVWVDLVRWSGETQPPLVTPLSEALDTSLNLTTGGEAE